MAFPNRIKANLLPNFANLFAPMGGSAVIPSFSPLSLFSLGEQGAWYDPSDLSTLFQDSAGTTPVASDSDPVGLMLDKSQGLVLGSEKISNTEFDVDFSGWVDYRSPIKSVTSSVGRVEMGATFSGIYTQVTLSVGRTYEIRVTMESSGFGAIGVGSSTSSLDTIYSGVVTLGEYVYRFTALYENSVVLVYNATGVTTNWLEVDSISVKELPGNHATQSISASRPTYKTDGTLHWLFNDQVDDSMAVTLPSIPSATVATSDDDGVTINYPVDLSSGSYTIDFNGSTNGLGYGVIIVDRVLTAGETTGLTNYLNAKRGA